MTKIKLFIIIPNLQAGGSEKVISNLVTYIDRENFDVTLVVGNKEGQYVKEIPVDIAVFDLKKERVRYAIIPIIRLIRKHKPDVVLSTLGHLNLLIALFRSILPKNTKFIARESNTISIRNKDESYPKLFDFLFKTVYKNFDLVICQAISMKEDLANNYGFQKNKMVVINNPIDFDKIDELSNQNQEFCLPKNKTNLLIVGRLSHQKRIDHAIKAMQLLSTDYHLTIIGDGELKNELQRLIEELELNNNIAMLGFVNNPYNLYKQADFLLSTSRYEGFPNVVLEANACGIPVIAYNYIGGISEIIVDKVNGVLVENGNIVALSKTILSSVNSSDYNKETIKKLTKKRFEVKKIVKEYEQEFLTINKHF